DRGHHGAESRSGGVVPQPFNPKYRACLATAQFRSMLFQHPGGWRRDREFPRPRFRGEDGRRGIPSSRRATIFLVFAAIAFDWVERSLFISGREARRPGTDVLTQALYYQNR